MKRKKIKQRLRLYNFEMVIPVELIEDFSNGFEIVGMDFQFDSTKGLGIHRHNTGHRFIFKKVNNTGIG